MTAAVLVAAILVVALVIFSLGFYFTQEKYLFGARKLAADHSFSFDEPFEERFIAMKDGARLNGLLFRAENPKGVILYLHGSKNALDFWGYTASFYTKLGYDIFYFDYRGFGKSEGRISSLGQLYGDIQAVYDQLKGTYGEERITLIGFSLGTGLAAYLARVNCPARVILLAPYYDYSRLIRRSCPVIMPFLIKYRIETHNYLRGCKTPVALFHGDSDSVISYSNSMELCRLLKSDDIFITLEGEGHDSLIFNRKYKREIARIL